MPKHLLPALALVAGLTACGGGSDDTLASKPTPTPTATSTPTSTATSTGSCTPSGTGTTDMGKKPVVTVPSTPAPTETTIVDVVCGTGAEAKDGSQVAVKYVGVLYDGGKEFDSSWSRGADQTLPFQVGGGVIPGFSKGTTGMKVGGRREVIIPAADGYGSQGSPPVIPPNATLIFVIDLVKVS